MVGLPADDDKLHHIVGFLHLAVIDIQGSQVLVRLAILHILGAEHTLSHFRPVKLRAKLHDGQLEAL